MSHVTNSFSYREPNDINESLRKYKLQPMTVDSDNEAVEMTTMRTVEVEDNVNMIQLVETVTVNIDQEDNEKEKWCNNHSSDWLC